MGDREVFLEPDLQCDICGEYGAYDFYGDFICQRCIDKLKIKSKSQSKRIKIQSKNKKDNE